MLNELASQVAQTYFDLKISPGTGREKLNQDDFARQAFGETLKKIKESLDNQLVQITATVWKRVWQFLCFQNLTEYPFSPQP